MRRPDALAPLLDLGIIDEVVRPLMSGKEAQVYLVEANGERCVAKVYKEAQNRTFKHRAAYTEGRSVRNTRDRRAMAKRSRHGRALDEESWRSAEVDVIWRLQAAGVRVPEPYNYVDGVLVMELVTDAGGMPAPRLADIDIDRAQGLAIHKQLLSEIVKMLCAGIVHGDLSEFNVLLSETGPVVIDFPQAVEAARNQSARRLLIRDVDNLGRYLCRPRRGRQPRYGQEMWAAYEAGELTPETRLTGLLAQSSQKKADTDGVLAEIEDVAREAERRGEGAPRKRRRRRRGGQRVAGQPGGQQESSTSKGPVVEIVRRRGQAAEAEPAPSTRPDERRRRGPSPAPPAGAGPGGGAWYDAVYQPEQDATAEQDRDKEATAGQASSRRPRGRRPKDVSQRSAGRQRPPASRPTQKTANTQPQSTAQPQSGSRPRPEAAEGAPKRRRRRRRRPGPGPASGGS